MNRRPIYCGGEWDYTMETVLLHPPRWPAPQENVFDYSILDYTVGGNSLLPLRPGLHWQPVCICLAWIRSVPHHIRSTNSNVPVISLMVPDLAQIWFRLPVCSKPGFILLLYWLFQSKLISLSSLWPQAYDVKITLILLRLSTVNT